MRFIVKGRIQRQKGHWVLDIPIFSITLSAPSYQDLITKLQSGIKAISKKSFGHPISVVGRKLNAIWFEIVEYQFVLPSILKIQRKQNGLNSREVAENLGLSDPLEYEQFENKETLHSIEKFKFLLSGIQAQGKSLGFFSVPAPSGTRFGKSYFAILKSPQTQ